MRYLSLLLGGVFLFTTLSVLADGSDLPEPDSCDFFPSPVQSWASSSSITFNNPPGLPNTLSKYYISGWSDAYKEKYLDSAVDPAQLKVGFDSVNEQPGGALTCHDGVCHTGGPKIKEPPPLVFPGTGDAPEVIFGFTPDKADEKGQCEAQLVGDTCDDNNRVVVRKHLKSLKVNGGNSNLLTVAFQNDMVHVVQSFVVNGGNVKVALADNSQHWFDEFIISSPSASIAAGKKSVINITQALNINNPTSINNSGNPDDLVIYAPAANTKFNFSKDNVVKALLLANEVTFNNGVHFIGAVTTNKLIVHSPSTLIEGQSECFTRSPKELMITPVSSTGLSCKGIDFDVKVVDSATKELVDYSGPVSVELLTHSAQGCVLSKGESPTSSCGKGNSVYSFSYPAPNSDRLSLTLFSRYVGNNYIRAWAENDRDELRVNKVGPYQFLGEAFVLDTTRDVNGVDGGQIAGRNYGLSIKAIATDNDSFSCHPIENYTQEKVPMTFSKSSPDGQALLDGFTITAGGRDYTIENNTSIPIKFSAGVSKTPLTATYGEAQQVILNVSGPAACTTDDNNQTDDGCISDKPMGSTDLNIYHRPFAFAMCDDDGTALPYGTSQSGLGLTAAGLEYPVVIKAIPWLNGYGDYDSGQLDNLPDTSSLNLGSEYSAYAATFCGADKLQAYTGTPSQTLPLHSPVNGTPGSPVIKDCVSEVNTGKQCLLWSEVGSLNVKAGHSNYLVSKLNVPEAPFVAGRFYPHHFALKSSELVDAVPNKFTYMDQAFTTSFEVEARNMAGAATLNYGDFAAGYQEELDLVAMDGGVSGTDKNELTPRLDKALLPSGWGQSWSKAVLKIENASVGFKREVTPPPPGVTPPPSKITTPDGPYDVRVGLVVNTPSVCETRGCTDFADQDLELRNADDVTPVKAIALAGNITARYGRLKLDDANSQFDKAVNVPVRAQYWDSSVTAFVLNTDDSTSQFDGSNYCKQMIWPTTPDDVVKSRSVLKESGTVSGGKSYVLEASPERSDYYREQVRFWLRLAQSPQLGETGVTCNGSAPVAGALYRPWLQYNWRDEGDEDPSAVVTFGVYRGNDRIIYRGEKGINKLLN